MCKAVTAPELCIFFEKYFVCATPKPYGEFDETS
jgi:hypothetical protein